MNVSDIFFEIYKLIFTNPAKTSDNLAGCCWMVLAMLGFAIEDSLIRLISLTVPFGQLLFFFGFGGALIFTLFCKAQK